MWPGDGAVVVQEQFLTLDRLEQLSGPLGPLIESAPYELVAPRKNHTAERQAVSKWRSLVADVGRWCAGQTPGRLTPDLALRRTRPAAKCGSGDPWNERTDRSGMRSGQVPGEFRKHAFQRRTPVMFRSSCVVVILTVWVFCAGAPAHAGPRSALHCRANSSARMAGLPLR
jgi:hypothetical protein